MGQKLVMSGEMNGYSLTLRSDILSDGLKCYTLAQ